MTLLGDKKDIILWTMTYIVECLDGANRKEGSSQRGEKGRNHDQLSLNNQGVVFEFRREEEAGRDRLRT